MHFIAHRMLRFNSLQMEQEMLTCKCKLTKLYYRHLWYIVEEHFKPKIDADTEHFTGTSSSKLDSMVSPTWQVRRLGSYLSWIQLFVTKKFSSNFSFDQGIVFQLLLWMEELQLVRNQLTGSQPPSMDFLPRQHLLLPLATLTVKQVSTLDKTLQEETKIPERMGGVVSPEYWTPLNVAWFKNLRVN